MAAWNTGDKFVFGKCVRTNQMPPATASMITTHPCTDWTWRLSTRIGFLNLEAVWPNLWNAFAPSMAPRNQVA